MWMSTPSSDPAPGQPSVTVSSTTATTISLSWSVPSGSVVESYEVTWEREGIRCSTTITDGSTSYTITRLAAEANYMITVAASNRTVSAVSDPVTGTTGRAGKIMCESIHIILHRQQQLLGGWRAMHWKRTGACTRISAMHTSALLYRTCYLAYSICTYTQHNYDEWCMFILSLQFHILASPG